MQVVERRREQAAEAAEDLNSKDNIAEVKEDLASDIAGLDEKLSGKITELDQRLSGKITALDQKLSGEITALDQKLSGEIAETRKDIHKLQLEMAVLRWMVGATLASVVPILVKLFFVA